MKTLECLPTHHQTFFEEREALGIRSWRLSVGSTLWKVVENLVADEFFYLKSIRCCVGKHSSLFIYAHLHKEFFVKSRNDFSKRIEICTCQQDDVWEALRCRRSTFGMLTCSFGVIFLACSNWCVLGRIKHNVICSTSRSSARSFCRSSLPMASARGVPSKRLWMLFGTQQRRISSLDFQIQNHKRLA